MAKLAVEQLEAHDQGLLNGQVVLLGLEIHRYVLVPSSFLELVFDDGRQTVNAKLARLVSVYPMSIGYDQERGLLVAEEVWQIHGSVLVPLFLAQMPPWLGQCRMQGSSRRVLARLIQGVDNCLCECFVSIMRLIKLVSLQRFLVGW